MLSKVLKYDFKAMGRILPLFYIALLFSTLIFGINLRFIPEQTVVGSILWSLSGSLYGIILIATAVVTLVVIISRYKKSLLGDSGYYMLTLPVKMETHIASKTISAVIWTLFSLIVAALSMMLIGIITYRGNIFDVLRHIYEELLELSGNDLFFLIILMIEFAIIGVLSIIKTTLTIYAALTFGQASRNHNNLLAVALYMGFGFIESTVITIVISIFDNLKFISDLTSRMFRTIQGVDLFMLLFIIFIMILCVIYFIITNLYMKNKLDI